MAIVTIVLRSILHWGFHGQFLDCLPRIGQASIVGSLVGIHQSGYESFLRIDRGLGLHVRDT